jgi:RNA polymerase sigma factor (sigma-70 family)
VSDDGFAEVFRAEQRRLVDLAFLLCGDLPAAEDAVVEAAARVLVRWRRGRVENPAAYLRRAVVNQVRSAGRGQTSRRRRDRRWALTNPSVAETAERGIVEQLDVAGLLASLPVRQRAVLALRFLDDRSVEETAEILEVSTGTVKSQTAKAMVKLRERVEVVFDDR